MVRELIAEKGAQIRVQTSAAGAGLAEGTENMAPRVDHFLLYLNGLTWTSGKTSDRLSNELIVALQKGVHVLLVHEMVGNEEQQARHAVHFSSFFETTPRDLVEAKLYAKLAVPYKGGEYRKVSMALLMLAIAEGPSPSSQVWIGLRHRG